MIPGRGDAASGDTIQAKVERRLGSKAFVVHRLDRETSGVLLFAKNADSHRDLSVQFESREIEKTYLALVFGHPPNSGEVKTPLREFGSGRVAVDLNGKPCATRWKVLKRAGGNSLLEVAPLTGRRHQIRVHLYSIGHPVLGDDLYGKDRPVGGAARLMLHAWKLAFRSKGMPVSIRCEPPPEFKGSS